MQKRKFVLKHGNKKHIQLVTIVLLLIFLTNSGAFALDPMGPTTAGLRQGQFEIGIDYINSTMDLELKGGKYSGELPTPEDPEPSGEAESFTLNDFEMNKIYANFSYGIWDGCELYLRLGGVSTEFGDSIWEAGEKYDGDTSFSFCLGSRATFYEIGDLKIGRLIQLSWASLDGDLNVPGWSEPDAVSIDLLEVQFAIGATYTAPNGTSIYGGPFLHFVDGEIEDTFIRAPGFIPEYTWDIEQSSTFGGYLGAQLNIAQNTFLNVEYQRTGGADAFGLGFLCRF